MIPRHSRLSRGFRWLALFAAIVVAGLPSSMVRCSCCSPGIAERLASTAGTASLAACCSSEKSRSSECRTCESRTSECGGSCVDDLCRCSLARSLNGVVVHPQIDTKVDSALVPELWLAAYPVLPSRSPVGAVTPPPPIPLPDSAELCRLHSIWLK